ncbi:hypothetical protein GIB67_039441 [Kingdonia uniflora]|uniref:DUF4283 domain-containing protein n=1 Tax=Kingdonia uniflora TaxID=39325 RepID=A0A7J7LIJ9_9MAGN|nr:hypothetical protein GIB67_039441 [Kingdonia uniflora]
MSRGVISYYWRLISPFPSPWPGYGGTSNPPPLKPGDHSSHSIRLDSAAPLEKEQYFTEVNKKDVTPKQTKSHHSKNKNLQLKIEAPLQSFQFRRFNLLQMRALAGLKRIECNIGSPDNLLEARRKNNKKLPELIHEKNLRLEYHTNEVGKERVEDQLRLENGDGSGPHEGEDDITEVEIMFVCLKTCCKCKHNYKVESRILEDYCVCICKCVMKGSNKDNSEGNHCTNPNSTSTTNAGLGYYFLKFSNSGDKERAIEMGHLHHVASKVFFIREWRPFIEYEPKKTTNLPLWVMFHNVPNQCWSKEGLGQLASLMGKPLYTDKAIERRSTSFARICIEVDVCDEL